MWWTRDSVNVLDLTQRLKLDLIEMYLISLDQFSSHNLIERIQTDKSFSSNDGSKESSKELRNTKFGLNQTGFWFTFGGPNLHSYLDLILNFEAISMT